MKHRTKLAMLIIAVTAVSMIGVFGALCLVVAMPPSVVANRIYANGEGPLARERASGSCPAPTSKVSDSAELHRALTVAQAGTVIELSPGTYQGRFSLTANGTPTRPIWICGLGEATLDGNDFRNGTELAITKSSNVFVSDLRITGSKKGITVDSSSQVTLAKNDVFGTGEEGIHLRSNTRDSVVSGNTVHSTGLKTPGWGEGIYVGTAEVNWCSYTLCNPDNSTGNRITNNVIFKTTAEGIDVKEGAEDGLILSNSIDFGQSTATSRAISIRSNGWLVANNTGVSSRGGDFIAISSTPVLGYGHQNLLYANSVRFQVTAGQFVVRANTAGNEIFCSNSFEGNAVGISNLACAVP